MDMGKRTRTTADKSEARLHPHSPPHRVPYHVRYYRATPHRAPSDGGVGCVRRAQQQTAVSARRDGIGRESYGPDADADASRPGPTRHTKEEGSPLSENQTKAPGAMADRPAAGRWSDEWTVAWPLVRGWTTTTAHQTHPSPRNFSESDAIAMDGRRGQSAGQRVGRLL